MITQYLCRLWFRIDRPRRSLSNDLRLTGLASIIPIVPRGRDGCRVRVMAKSQITGATNLSQLVAAFRWLGKPGGRQTLTLRGRSRRFAAPQYVRKLHATPAQIVASNHAGLEALKKGLEVGNASCDDAEVLHYLRAHSCRPEIQRRILRIRCVVKVEQLSHRRRHNPTTRSASVQLRV